MLKNESVKKLRGVGGINSHCTIWNKTIYLHNLHILFFFFSPLATLFFLRECEISFLLFFCVY